MALPGMDLQSQYNQTLQNTIGQSQSERLRQTRQQQSLANTDWSQRGVGDGAKRMAGFQEVNPSAMPHMSGDTRSFIQPLLGNYQEGGKQVEGYYGSDNPYMQGGLESLLSKQGYARAPSSLGEQFKSVGLKLPNAYGQEYYNASHEDVGNKISAYQQQNALRQQQPAFNYSLYSDPWGSSKAHEGYAQSLKALEDEQAALQGHTMFDGMDDFLGTNSRIRQIQGQLPLLKLLAQQRPDLSDADAWKKTLYDRVTSSTADYQNRYAPGKASIDKYVDYGFRPGQSVGDWQWTPYNQSIMGGFNNGEDSLYEKDSGFWLHKNGSPRGITYSPSLGFWESDFDHAPKGMGKIMPALTMTALGAMFGGAGALAGGGAGTVGGAVGQGIGAAIPSTIQTGTTTGDWGKALGTGGINALAGGLGGAYGGDLAKTLGLSGQTGTNIAKGLISGTVNTLGKSALGGKLDYKNALVNTLSNLAAPYLGDLTKNAVGGTGGDILGGAVGGFSGSALKNILQGKSLDINTALSTLQGATGGLGKLFSNTNEDKQSVNGPTSLARTLQGVKNGPAATSRRT